MASRSAYRSRDGSRLLVAGTAHADAAQSVAADFLRSTQREIEHTSVREWAAVLHRTFDALAVLEIGHHEDGAERLGAMRAGHLVGLEALAARVPLVFPIHRGFFIVGRRTRD